MGQDDEYIYSTRLNVNNEINYYKTFNPYTSEFYKWSDGYQNLFSFVNLSDFDKNEQNIYTLSKDVINEKKLSNYISVLLYDNPGFEFETFNLFLDDDVFNIYATSIPFEGSITYAYSFKGTISYGDDILLGIQSFRNPKLIAFYISSVLLKIMTQELKRLEKTIITMT